MCVSERKTVYVCMSVCVNDEAVCVCVYVCDEMCVCVMGCVCV